MFINYFVIIIYSLSFISYDDDFNNVYKVNKEINNIKIDTLIVTSSQ